MHLSGKKERNEQNRKKITDLHTGMIERFGISSYLSSFHFLFMNHKNIRSKPELQ
jgi:hypothetical protein